MGELGTVVKIELKANERIFISPEANKVSIIKVVFISETVYFVEHFKLGISENQHIGAFGNKIFVLVWQTHGGFLKISLEVDNGLFCLIG